MTGTSFHKAASAASGRLALTLFILGFAVLSLTFAPCAARAQVQAQAQKHVEILDNQLQVDQQPQPQLFGAEVQYFRLRGGYRPNVPRATVLALWAKALDRLVEAKMNSISFYIPWDFHEYAEGKFDFTGTVDEDGDGNPDYPSRDVITFFKMIEARGIKRIMVRPGPYINAEWGFLGFGAVPEWFHDKYPDSHMMTSWGWPIRLFDYHNPDLLRHTQLWFEALHREVLKSRIGPGKPIVFLQVDNETNYQWSSIYTGDYGPRAKTRYRAFLQDTYHDIATLNRAHGRAWAKWDDIQPPTAFGANLGEDQDWYHFADYTIATYLEKIRRMWEGLGVHEPDVLFTLAESYNALGNGLLPNYVYRNLPGKTGLMTVNLYPKTFETRDHALMNSPFKTDLDVKAADEANDTYLGSKQEWVMGPEIQGGWWKGVDVTDASRQQTYLSVLGHGMKALFIYYFNEGQNWGVEWAQNKIRPLFNQLRSEWNLEQVAVDLLTNQFWGELQARSDRLILLGFDVRRLMQVQLTNEKTLYFDAPLDQDANPRGHYDLLKRIGERVISPYQDFLARALEVQDEVSIVKDSAQHAASPDRAINSLWASADWTAGLLGNLMNADVNPRILHGELSTEAAFKAPKVLVHVDTGLNAARTLSMLKDAHVRGQGVINFLSDSVAQSLGYGLARKFQVNLPVPNPNVPPLVNSRERLTFYVGPKGVLRTGTEPDAIAKTMEANGPIYGYDVGVNASTAAKMGCQGIMFYQNDPVAYRCQVGAGEFIQVGALIFDDFNSGEYGTMTDAPEKRLFMQALMKEFNVRSHVTIDGGAQQTVAFARKDPKKQLLWVTVKTGNRVSQNLHLKVSGDLLLEVKAGAAAPRPNDQFRVKDLLGNSVQLISRADLLGHGFDCALTPDDSHVFVVEPAIN